MLGHTAAPVHGALLPIRDLDEPALAAWRTLAGAAREPNPFFEPELATAAAQHLPGGEHDLLLAIFEDEAMVLALPVRRRRSYRRLPVPSLLAWGHTHAFLDAPLLAAADPAGAVACALDTARASGARWLVLERTLGEGPGRQALDLALARRGAGAVALTRFERPVVHRRPAATYLDGRLSGQRRKNLRRQGRRLAEALGPVTIRDRAAGDFDATLERFLALERAGWKGQAGTAVSSDPGHAAFFRAGMGALARAGRVQAWTLEAGEETVAVLLAVVSGGGAFHVKTAYDEAHAPHSPGTQLEIGVLEAFHDDPALQWIDSCTSTPESTSALLYPDRQPVEALIVPLAGAAARVAARAVRSARGLRTRHAVTRAATGD